MPNHQTISLQFVAIRVFGTTKNPKTFTVHPLCTSPNPLNQNDAPSDLHRPAILLRLTSRYRPRAPPLRHRRAVREPDLRQRQPARAQVPSLPFVPGGTCIARVAAVPVDATRLAPGQLVSVEMTVRARDDPGIKILRGFHEGATRLLSAEGGKGGSPWRNGVWEELAAVG